jgi:hypothetical protein
MGNTDTTDMAQNGNTMYLFVALLATTPGNIISYIICG